MDFDTPWEGVVNGNPKINNPEADNKWIGTPWEGVVDNHPKNNSFGNGVKTESMEAAEAILLRSSPTARRVRRSLEALEDEVIAERYQILRRIGKGGMGVVYLAQQTNLNRDVCIKVLNPDFIDDESAIVRFEREAKGLSRLQHPNIVTIFDYGRDGDLAYIVMEYAQGETLSRFIKANKPLSLSVFLPIAIQTLKGIGEAHKLGLIHRDIKPANIILCELEGEKNFVKILDFGLAKLAQGQEDVTKDQQLVGSASFMAPEQILTGASDARTDVYALGVMFYMMLAGEKPFIGSNDNVILYKHVNEAPAPLRLKVKEDQGIPETLCETIDQCLNKDPDQRPQSAIALLDAISYALDAPQLRSSWSSVSLGKIDLLKMSEDADTRVMNHTSHQSLPALPPATPSTSKPRLSFPATPPVTSSPHSSGSISAISDTHSRPDHPSASFPSFAPATHRSHRQTQSAKDRRMLLLIIAGLVFVAIITVVIAAVTRKPSTDPNTQTLEANKEHHDAIFLEIEQSIAQGRWQFAEDLLNTIQNTATESSEILRLSALKTQIENGKLLTLARIERDNGNIKAAQAHYETLITKDASHEMAKTELAQMLADNATGSVTFQISPQDGLTLHINDTLYTSPPQSLDLPPGSYSLRITRDGYQDWTGSVTIQAAKDTQMSITLERRRPTTTHPRKDHTTRDNLLLGGSRRDNKSSGSGLLLD